MTSQSKTSFRHSANSKRLFRGADAESVKSSFLTHLEYSLAKDEYTATVRDLFKSLSLAVRDRMVERWIATQQTYYRESAKRVYYLSLEFLVGRTLGNSVMKLGLEESVVQAVKELGYNLEELEEIEFDAGLGNGGLGRLAACFYTLTIAGYL